MKTLLATLLIALLAGCATPPPAPTGTPVDRSYSARGQSSRVKFIIVHYTVGNLPVSLKTLTQEIVSSHYLVSDEAAPVIYGLVDESRQANHAGVSNWKGYTMINGSSIGIEIVNPGFTESPNGRVYYPFPQAQIDRVIVLIKEIAARHGVPPENVLGHSDVAPQRKQDPGPLFPWAQLAREGLVVWPDATRVAVARAVYDNAVPDAAWFQKRLGVFGYAVPQNGALDEATRNVIAAFQTKYRPAGFTGAPDGETAAILWALTPTVAAEEAAAAAAAAPVPVPVEPVPPVKE